MQSATKEGLKAKAKLRRGSLSKQKAVTSKTTTQDDSFYRTSNSPPPEGRQSKLGFLKQSIKETTSVMKEGVRRSASAMLQRPGSSRSSSKERAKAKDAAGAPETIELQEDSVPTRTNKPGAPPPKIESNWGAEIPARPPSAAGKRRNAGLGRGKPARQGSDEGADGMIELADGRSDSPDIPRIQEIQTDEYGGSNVALAPNVAVHHVASYKELDNELLKQAAFSTLDSELDLTLLAKTLCSEPDAREDDVVWTWDYLFTHISSHLRQEWDQQTQHDTSETHREAKDNRPPV